MSTTFLYLFLLSITVAAAKITTISSDIAALKAVKSAINPTTIPSYTCLHSWDFTSDPCSPPHVTHFLCGLSCSGNRVTQLTLDPAGYAGTLSPLVAQLVQLITIDLSDNKFSGPIPTSLFTLPNLQTLILGSNSFSGVIPPEISNLKKLQTLDISHNFISGSLPNSLASLTELTRLDSSFNKLTGPIPTLPKNLIELALKSNSLSGYLQKHSFTELTQLEVVELSENSLTGTIPAWFFLIPSLQQVNLAHNNFTGLNILKPVNSNLIAVDLGYNSISGYPPENFPAYPMLASLTLSYNKLRGRIPLEYSKFSRLFLDGNFLISLPSEFFSRKISISGSLGDNCLKSCPASSELCLKKQKPLSICRQVYHGKPKPKS
ncbi:putative non-specific serine/threonine protein kinase [Helianthus debilis subsp. tardiflorus]